MADLDNRCGDGSDMVTLMEGPKTPAEGLRKEQVMATALDPR